MMDRKRFLLLCGAIASGIAVPGVMRWYRKPVSRPWWYPESLAPLLDDATMRGIGSAYRAGTPAESTEAVLLSLLLAGPDGSLPSADDTAAARRLVERMVQCDFAAGRTAVAAGWILAITEARQCALLSLEAGEPRAQS